MTMSRTWKLAAAIALSAGIGGTLGGIAWGSVPDSSGVIHTCYSQANGTWRPIDYPTQKCKSGETLLDVNQKGVKGDAGAVGPAGPAGPAGPMGPAGPAGAAGGLSSLDDLEGKGCNTANPDLAGRVHVAYDNSPDSNHALTITCQPTKVPFRLSVISGQIRGVDEHGQPTVEAAGSGSVTVSPPGATYASGQDVILWYAPGTIVTLTAYPDAGSQTWTQVADCDRLAETCTFTITGDTGGQVFFNPVV
jgi:hypothetical protein